MLIQLSHKRIGRLFFRKLDTDDHPKSSLILRAICEADAFQGTIRFYEYISSDGPLHLFTYTLEPAVELNIQHDSEGLKMIIMIAGRMNFQPGITDKMFLPEGTVSVFRTSKYLLDFPQQARVRYLVVDIGPLAHRFGIEGLIEGRYELTMAMKTYLAEILEPPLRLGSPEKWLAKKLAKILYELEEAIESATQKTGNTVYKTDYALKADAYIKLHVTGKITTVLVSKNIGINDCKLKKVYKNEFGTTIGRRQRDLKVEHSMSLLLQTDSTIAEIARMCGFNSEQAFRSNFFKYTDLKPAKWRKKYRK